MIFNVSPYPKQHLAILNCFKNLYDFSYFLVCCFLLLNKLNKLKCGMAVLHDIVSLNVTDV